MAHNLLVVGFGDRLFNFPVTKDVEATRLRGWLDQRLGTGLEYHLTRGGAPLGDTDVVPCEGQWGTTLIRAHPILRGGKGGFGALIRAVGSRRNRSGGKEACRDLSGRRLRDVNAQKKVAKWLEDEPERKRKRQEEKRKRLLTKKVPPKHFFDDQAYMEQLRNNEEGMDDALKQGLEASGLKRKQPAESDDTAGPSSAKKSKFWVGGGEEEDLSSVDSSEEESESEAQEYKGVESGPGSSKALNSAGSSDEAVQSKPSDEEDTGSAEKNRETDGSSETPGGDTHVPQDDSPASAPAAAAAESEGDGETVRDCSKMADERARPETGGEESASQDKEVAQDKKEETQDNPVTTEPPKDEGPLDLNDYGSVEELESVGGERLKSVLQSLGLKCGGTLQERAQRLFSTKGKSLEELDPSLFAKAGKSRKRKNKAPQ